MDDTKQKTGRRAEWPLLTAGWDFEVPREHHYYLSVKFALDSMQNRFSHQETCTLMN